MTQPPPRTPVKPDAPFLSIGFTQPSLCTRCGSCSGICPHAAIGLTEDGFPKLIPERCTSCGLCGKVCPGARVSYGDFAEQVFGERFVDAGFDGKTLETHVGYATDDTLRAGGAGGGVITALLWDLLKRNVVQGCLVTRMKPDRPWEAEPFIAESYEDLLASQGSRYMIIPHNRIWAALRERKGRFAMAALPCQIHGFRLLQKADPELASRIEIALGLFCGGSLEPTLVPELLAARGIRKEEIRDFQFRGGEWPGRMQAILHDGTVRPLHESNYKDGAYNYCTALYMPERCQTCMDGSSEFADLAVSDAWTRDESGNYKFKSQSRVLIRTPRGARAFQEALDSGAIVMQNVSSDPNYRTHKLQTKRKGFIAPLRVERWKKAGRPVPETDRSAPEATWRERAAERAVTALLTLGRYRCIRFPLIAFLTSKAALPLIRLRLFLKKRKYK
ncbi:MAG: Coenzyme F420 hydrogenase/dehydrogenase, beta subunit C-terminal domain, partial [Kiritimatiellia bacterium]|nr:Coenzyme F420 hydrogenase/dehydrogenase, beta subunit C-terminal domain [Kiritimatiellia bacterium]